MHKIQWCQNCNFLYQSKTRFSFLDGYIHLPIMPLSLKVAPFPSDNFFVLATPLICRLNIENWSMHVDLFDFLLSGTWIMKHSVQNILTASLSSTAAAALSLASAATAPRPSPLARTATSSASSSTSWATWSGSGTSTPGRTGTSGSPSSGTTSWSVSGKCLSGRCIVLFTEYRYTSILMPLLCCHLLISIISSSDNYFNAWVWDTCEMG